MKIIIVDDDKIISASLKIIIESTKEIEVLAMGHNAEEAISLYKTHKPDVILMDIRMGEKTGIDAAKDIISEYPEAKVLFLTTFSDHEYIIAALKTGAKGYILKQHYESIVPALKAVDMGQNVFGDEIVSKLPEMLNSKSNYKDYMEKYQLSEKEIEIIELISKGLSNKEISGQIFLSEGTIRNYISNILEKLSLRDRTQLAIFYFNHLK
ncbi:two component transcriptional regulator, LuxR family [Hathewaya proteolytica DSM 3090]|uniref:Stage 0 sporulation protein A homolog n=1 Tax=Hathewaya proteolytica DSM 3090 TaxID=1121331 RepID=A0A1M6SL76_9CLOT|nr:response regulator transcription factor [Hathewaya proteolytica]SHK45443.1 two component transcriptional regulator, LuxR family [Hathewaya proteolytica DSM 3090]